LNPSINPFQRSFVGEIRRFEDMARRVRFFASQIEKEKDVVPIRPLYDSAPLITVGPGAAHNIDELDVTLAEHESRLLKMNESYKTLSERTAELIEARHVLRETAVFFDKAGQLSLIGWVCIHLPKRLERSKRISEPPSMTARRLFFNMMTVKTSILPTFSLI
jgi:V-type H+-transporting ATPase subunit a